MFAEEQNSDSVSRVKTKINEIPFFIASLIKHKSNVDYNVVMQVFRYLVFIWEDYGKEMEKQDELSVIMMVDRLKKWKHSQARLRRHGRIIYTF